MIRYKEKTCKICGIKYRPNKSYKVYCPECYIKHYHEIREGAVLRMPPKKRKYKALKRRVGNSPTLRAYYCELCGEPAIFTKYDWGRRHICEACQDTVRGFKYRKWRDAVLDRDNQTCCECGENGNQAHHILSWANYPDKRFDIDNGQTLCGACHKKTNSYLKRLKREDEEDLLKKREIIT